MIRAIHFLISLLAYAMGMGSLALFILFVGGWTILPWVIDGKPTTSIATAIVINLSLVLLFGIQHSVMARRGFKQLITQVIPTSLERSTYCLATAVTIGLMCYCWQPLAGTVWQVEIQSVRFLLTGVQLMGWALVVASSFMINHFELFGVKQTLDQLVNRPEPKPTFVVKYMYRFVRHPLQLGMLIGIWATPDMSVSHLILSAAMTMYITIGLYFEESDLVSTLGEDYVTYRKIVPMIVPKTPGVRWPISREDATAITESATLKH